MPRFVRTKAEEEEQAVAAVETARIAAGSGKEAGKVNSACFTIMVNGTLLQELPALKSCCQFDTGF
jgi:hypothetical protein